MTTTDEDDPLIGYREMAEIAGLPVDTVRSYRTRRVAHFPEPEVRILGHPRWRRSAFLAWLDERPGKGWRERRGRVDDAP